MLEFCELYLGDGQPQMSIHHHNYSLSKQTNNGFLTKKYQNDRFLWF